MSYEEQTACNDPSYGLQAQSAAIGRIQSTESYIRVEAIRIAIQAKTSSYDETPLIELATSIYEFLNTKPGG